MFENKSQSCYSTYSVYALYCPLIVPQKTSTYTIVCLCLISISTFTAVKDQGQKKTEGPSIYYVGIFSGILTPPPLSLIQVPKLKSHPKTKKNIEKSILKLALQKVHSHSFSKNCLCMLAFQTINGSHHHFSKN